MYILQVENLYKTYNHVEAIKGISFSIKKERYMDFWVQMEQEKVHLSR